MALSGTGDAKHRYVTTDDAGNIYLCGCYRNRDIDFDPGPEKDI